MRIRIPALIAVAGVAGSALLAAHAMTSAGAAVSDTGSAGAATLGSTAYPVPSDALFVATDGSDTNPGTQDAPLATLAKAVSLASGGRTIVLRKGLYHESVNVGVAHQVTIENYPGEPVWLDGSEVVPDWTASGATWVHTGWSHHFDHTAGYSAHSAAIGHWIDPAYPMAAHPEQVWVGRRWLREVSSEAAVGRGQFYYDEAGDRLVIGSDPTGKTVHAASLSTGLTIRSAHSIVRGIGIRRYATSLPELGALRIWGDGTLVENVVVSEIASSGIGVSAMNVTLDHVTGKFCGLLGMHANESWGLTMDGLLMRNNNREHFADTSPVQGGIKIAKSRDVVLRNSVIRDNAGENGVWFDQSSYHVTITGNRITDNGRVGLYTEISSVFLIADNYIVDNGLDQLRIVDTNQVRVWNNTLGGGVARAVGITQDTRRAANLSLDGHDPLRPLPDPTITWLVGDVTFANNVVGSGPLFYLYVMDKSHQRSADAMHVTINGNLFSPQPRHFADLAWGQADGVHYTKFVTGPAINVTPVSGLGNQDNPSPMHASDLADSPAAQAAAGAMALPSDIAAAIGQPAGTKHLGSF